MTAPRWTGCQEVFIDISDWKGPREIEFGPSAIVGWLLSPLVAGEGEQSTVGYYRLERPVQMLNVSQNSFELQ